MREGRLKPPPARGRIHDESLQPPRAAFVCENTGCASQESVRSRRELQKKVCGDCYKRYLHNTAFASVPREVFDENGKLRIM